MSAVKWLLCWNNTDCIHIPKFKLLTFLEIHFRTLIVLYCNYGLFCFFCVVWCCVWLFCHLFWWGFFLLFVCFVFWLVGFHLFLCLCCCFVFPSSPGAIISIEGTVELKEIDYINFSKLQYFENIAAAAENPDMVHQLEEVLMIWYRQIEQVSFCFYINMDVYKLYMRLAWS